MSGGAIDNGNKMMWIERRLEDNTSNIVHDIVEQLNNGDDFDAIDHSTSSVMGNLDSTRSAVGFPQAKLPQASNAHPSEAPPFPKTSFRFTSSDSFHVHLTYQKLQQPQ